MDHEESIKKRLEESIKTAQVSVLTFWTLILMCIVLLTTAHTANTFKIPLLDLSLDKANGIEILMFLVFVALLRSLIMRSYALKLEKLLDLQNRKKEEIILTRPPSVSSYFELFSNRNPKFLRRFGFYFGIVTALFLTVFNGVEQHQVKEYWSISWAITAVINLGLSITAVVIFERLESRRIQLAD